MRIFAVFKDFIVCKECRDNQFFCTDKFACV